MTSKEEEEKKTKDFVQICTKKIMNGSCYLQRWFWILIENDHLVSNKSGLKVDSLGKKMRKITFLQSFLID